MADALTPKHFAIIRVAKEQVGMSEGDYRAILFCLTGQETAKALKPSTRTADQAVAGENSVKPPTGNQPLTGRLSNRIRARKEGEGARCGRCACGVRRPMPSGPGRPSPDARR